MIPVEQISNNQEITEKLRLIEQREHMVNAQSEALRLASLELNSTLEPDEVIRRVLTNVARIVPNDGSNLVMLDGDRRTVYQVKNPSSDQNELARWSLAHDYHSFSVVEKTIKFLCIPDTCKDPEWIPTPTTTWVRSFLSAPLIQHGRLIGIINLHSREPEYFNESDGSHLQIFSNAAGMAIENARLYHETSRRAAELEALARVSARLKDISKRDSMIQVIFDETTRLVDASGVLLAVCNPLTGSIVIEQAAGEAKAIQGKYLISYDGITSRVFKTRQPYQADSIDNLPIPEGYPGYPQRAACCIPLNGEETLQAALWIVRPRPFTGSEVKLLTAIGDIAAGALHRADLFECTLRNAINLETVNRLGRELGELHDLQLIYQRLTQAVLQWMPDLAVVAISLYSPETQQVACAYVLADGRPADICGVEAITLPSLQHSVILSHKAAIINDLPTLENTFEYLSREPRSAMLAPMLAQGQAMGVIQVQSYHHHVFSQADSDLLTLIANTAAIAIENAHLLNETQAQLSHLAALHAIDEAINSSLALDDTLNVLLQQAIDQLNVDAAGVLLFQPDQQVLEYAAGMGFHNEAYSQTRVEYGKPMAGIVLCEQEPVILHEDDERFFIPSCELKSEGFRFYAAFPLIAKDLAMGVFEVFHRTPFYPNQNWISFVEALASQAAIAVSNAGLFEDLQRSNAELGDAYDNTLQAMMRTLELRDDETEVHARRVVKITTSLARRINLPESEIEHIRQGALLHDIGKIGIPDFILRKQGPLSASEWVIMKKHPQMAYDLLHPISYLAPALDIPYCHHEKWDGSGYPRGLRGEEIPLSARLFALADVWDALSSDRPYRKAWPVEKIIAYIRAQAGHHFDPRLVEIFLNEIIDSESI